MRIFTTRTAARRAIDNQAVKICHGLYTEGKPSPRELAEIVSRRWPDSALDGYSCAHHYLGHALSFPLHFLRAGTMASSPYFRSRRARPKALGQLNGINVCNPLQATEIMAEEDAVAFLEAYFAGRYGATQMEGHMLDFQRFPQHTRRVLENTILGADSVPERNLTRALRPHVTVHNNRYIGPYRWDLLLKEHKLAIEVDGYAYHQGENRQRFEIDRQKLNDAVQRGYKPLHFTAATIEHHLDMAVGQVLAIVHDKGDTVQPPWQWHHYWRFQH